MGNDHQLSLLLLHKIGDMVDSILQYDGLLSWCYILASLALLLSHHLQAFLLLTFCLRSILVQQLEELRRCENWRS